MLSRISAGARDRNNITVGDLDRELREIDEDLMRAGLGPSEQAQHLKRRHEFDGHVGELAKRIGAMNRYNLRLVKELVSRGYDLLEGHPS